MIYSIDMDDFSNSCGTGEFPLTSAVAADLSEGGPVPTEDQVIFGGEDDSSGNQIWDHNFTVFVMVCILN